MSDIDTEALEAEAALQRRIDDYVDTVARAGAEGSPAALAAPTANNGDYALRVKHVSRRNGLF